MSRSSGNFEGMEKAEEFQALISKNIKFFMRLPDCKYRTANALAVKAKLSPNTVRNYIDGTKRTVTTSKPQGFPTLDKLAKLTRPLNCEVWELLHPDIERSRREREMYKKIEQNFSALPREQEEAEANV